MTRKSIAIGTTAAALVGVLAYAATGPAARRFGQGASDHERIIMAVMNAKLDIVAERLGLTPEQKAQVEEVRDGLIADFKARKAQRQELRRRFLDEFKKDNLTRQTLDKLAEERKAAGEDMKQAVIQAILDIHATLSPEQRGKLGELCEERAARHALQ